MPQKTNLFRGTLTITNDLKYLLNKQLFFSKAIFAYNRPAEEKTLNPWYGSSNPSGLNINIGVIDDGIIDRHMPYDEYISSEQIKELRDKLYSK